MTEEITDLLLDDLVLLDSQNVEHRTSEILKISKRVAQGASDVGVVDRLLERAKSEPNDQVKHAWLSYFAASNSPKFIDVIEDWINSSEDCLRLKAVTALAWNKSDRVNEMLVRVLAEEPSQRVRRLALKYLIRRGTLGKWSPHPLGDVVREDDWRPTTFREYKKLIEQTEA